jgi:hypothetical protein
LRLKKRVCPAISKTSEQQVCLVMQACLFFYNVPFCSVLRDKTSITASEQKF